MAQISVSLPADGTTADVSDYNTPVNTIVADYNGNIDNSNIAAAAAIAGSKLADSAITTAKLADASVTYAKLLSTIFSGQTTSDTNPGTAGGSRNYVNVGGIKLCWGVTAAQATVGAAPQTITKTVTLPVGFFTNISFDVNSARGPFTNSQYMYTNTSAITTSTLTIGFQSTNGSNATGAANWLCIGT